MEQLGGGSSPWTARKGFGVTGISAVPSVGRERSHHEGCLGTENPPSSLTVLGGQLRHSVYA